MTTTAFDFDWGFSDGGPELLTMPDSVFDQIATLRPDYWRVMNPWSLVASTTTPGPYQGRGSAVVTATATGSGYVGNPHTNGALTTRASASGTGRVTGAAPGMAGRDWTYPDRCVNEIRLKTGAEVLMIIGQSRPANYTNAQFQAFCAETVARYGPGGPGIRTDGPYAALAGWGVTFYEIWNEPNQINLWTAPVSAVDYTTLLIAAYAGIKSVLPGSQSTVLFAGLQHQQYVGSYWGQGYNSLDEYTFLQQCYAAGAHGHFDAMATHVYPYTDVATSQFTITGGVSLPGQCTTGALTATALATGTGQLNLSIPSKNGRLQAIASATGSGQLNWYLPAGPAPSMAMDNFRQVQALYALMVANGDGALGMWITELGYCVYQTTITPALQSTYIQACWALLNTLPYIDVVIIYNAMDANNSLQNDGVNGYGAIDFAGNPRPIYNWLQTLTPLTATSATTITATATGTGSIGGNSATVITFAASGSGLVRGGGGVITATATGMGAIGIAPVHVVFTATARGSGFVAVFGSGGNGTSGGVTVAIARASGLGRLGINVATNGDLLVTAAATGTGVVNENAVVTVVSFVATATGTGFVTGGETGVVGTFGTGAPKIITATAAGQGSLAGAGGAGLLAVTATATGTGLIGVRGSGAAVITATATTTGVPGYTGTAAPSFTATALGAGLRGAVGSAAVAFLATGTDATGSHVGRLGGAVVSIVATPAGVGTLPGAGNGFPVFTATALGTGVVAESSGGTEPVTATATGAGVVGLLTGAAPSFTATASGAGVVGKVGAAAPVVTVTAANTQVGAGSGGGTSVITATATGTGGIVAGSGNAVVAATAATSQAMAVAYAFTGTTYGPFSTPDLWGNGVNYAVVGGVATEGVSPGPGITPTGGFGGTVFTGVPYPVPMGTNLHWAAVVADSGTLSSAPRSVGVGVGGSVEGFTNGVIGLIAGNTGNFFTSSIYSKVGSSYVLQASIGSAAAPAGSVVACQITYNGTNFVYTLYLNGVATLSWTDTANVIGTPGNWVSPAFGGIYSSGYFGSVGITAFSANDLGSPGPTSGGTPSITATAMGSGVVGDVADGPGPFVATAIGTGVVAGTRTGTSTITATGTGTGVVNEFTGAAPSFTATGTGVGVVGTVTGGTSSVTATATGTGVVGAVTGAAVSITATATGAGVVALATGGAFSVTATGTGTGIGGVTVTASRPLNVNVTVSRASTF